MEKAKKYKESLQELNNATSDFSMLHPDTIPEEEYRDLWQKLKEPKKIEKKSMGGLIDKPLIGGSRYI